MTVVNLRGKRLGPDSLCLQEEKEKGGEKKGVASLAISKKGANHSLEKNWQGKGSRGGKTSRVRPRKGGGGGGKLLQVFIPAPRTSNTNPFQKKGGKLTLAKALTKVALHTLMVSSGRGVMESLSRNPR